MKSDLVGLILTYHYTLEMHEDSTPFSKHT